LLPLVPGRPTVPFRVRVPFTKTRNPPVWTWTLASIVALLS